MERNFRKLMKKLTKNGESAERARKFCKYVNGLN
jgi:hypothetical protein